MKKKLFALLLTVIMTITAVMPVMAEEMWPGYPGPDELPVQTTIPSPFKFFNLANDPNGDGVVSSVEEWDARREEIKDIIQRYWYGYKWPTASEDVWSDSLTTDDPNTVTFGSGWSTAAINIGEAFEQLVADVQAGEVVVGDQTFGPVAEDEAEATALEAYNAGYTIVKPGFFGNVICKLVDKTGELASVEDVPAKTKPVKHLFVCIQNPDNGADARFEITTMLPTAEQKIANWGDADAVVPFMIGIGGTFNTAALLNAGYGIVSFSCNDIYPDKEGGNGHEDRSGVYTTLYPYDPTVYEYSSGRHMAMAWAAGRILDAMENETLEESAETGITLGESLGLDPTKTGVTGHSRNGQATIVTAAFEDRIRVALPSEPATSSNRYKVEGKIFGWNNAYYPAANIVFAKTGPSTNGLGGTWFSGRADVFSEGYRELLLPYDPGELIALVAPRPYLAVSGLHQAWQGNEGLVAVVQAAAEVYDFIGKNDTEKNNCGVRARESSHSFYYNYDVPYAIAILDREFKQGEDDTKLHLQDLTPVGNSAQNMSFPARDYDNISDMSLYPFDLSSYYTQWSSPVKYMLWTAQDSFIVGHNETIVAHSDAPDVVLTTPAGVVIKAASKKGEEFSFNVTADQAVYGRYKLTTVGADKQNRDVYFSAISVADALRHGAVKGDEGEENRVLGFSSRLANTEQDPPVVKINGVATDMNFTSNRTPDQETTLMAYGIQFHDKLFIRIANEGWDEKGTFSVENLKFVTLPEYVFEFSMAKIPASAANNGKDQAAGFAKKVSWPVEKWNNGMAVNWPQVPYGPEERAIWEAAGGGEAGDAAVLATRPDGPGEWTTDFKATVTDVITDTDTITLKFSEPLDKGEYAFGLNIADKWTTTWNEAGDAVTIAIKNFTSDSAVGNLIIFRLMDLEGNLIAGPREVPFTLAKADNDAPAEAAPAAPAATAAPAAPAAPVSPKTADNFSLFAMTALFAAIAAMSAVTYRRKRS